MVYYIKTTEGGEVKQFTTKLEAKGYISEKMEGTGSVFLAYTKEPVDPNATVEFRQFNGKGKNAEDKARQFIDDAS